MSKGKIIAAVAGLVVVGLIVAVVAFGAGGAGVEVDVAEAAKGDLAVTVSASGKIVPGTKADVFPLAAGTVADVAVIDGQEVKAGQVLAVLDTGSLELSVEQARAGVAGAQAQLAGISKQMPSAEDREAARAGADAAYTAYVPARDAYRAFKDVYDETTNTVVKKSMEPSLTALDIAQKQAYAGYASAAAGQAKTEQSFVSERAGAQAAIDQANAALTFAQKILDDATIEAPVDGVVLFNAIGAPGADGQTPRISEGAAVAPGSAPFTIVQLDAVRFAAEVDEVDIDRVEKGMGGVISLDAFPGEEMKSKVAEMSAAAQLTATGGTVFPVYFDLKGTERALRIGMKGDVAIEVKAVTGAVYVPIEALFDEDGEEFVYVVENGVLARRAVTTGVLTDTRAQIVKGLEAGEQVALSGAVELADGMSVRVKK